MGDIFKSRTLVVASEREFKASMSKPEPCACGHRRNAHHWEESRLVCDICDKDCNDYPPAWIKT